jgi:energy-coupling factor transport system substrate-specific component
MSKESAGKRNTARGMILSIFCMAAIVLLLVFGGKFFGSGHAYGASLVVVVLSMLPFFFAFEGRRPQAREMITLAVLCAIAVVSRVLFIWLPNFKPMTAIIIIVGAALGAQAGFMTGAMAAFVSNFIFGQGPWTPWQMLAFGVAGFLAGVLCKNGPVSKKRLPLSIFGAAMVMVLIGPILDTSALFMMNSVITPANAAAVYLSGIPVNAVHAAATFLTLLVLSQPMFEKLDRMQQKYGILEESA